MAVTNFRPKDKTLVDKDSRLKLEWDAYFKRLEDKIAELESAVDALGAITPPLEFIETRTFTAASTVDFTSIPANTGILKFTVTITAVSSDGAALNCRFSQSGSFLSGASDYAYGSPGNALASAPAGAGATASSSILLASAIDAAGYAELGLEINLPLASGNRKYIHGRELGTNAASALVYQLPSGALIANTNAIDGVQFLPSAGTMTGFISAWAIKE